MKGAFLKNCFAFLMFLWGRLIDLFTFHLLVNGLETHCTVSSTSLSYLALYSSQLLFEIHILGLHLGHQTADVAAANIEREKWAWVYTAYIHSYEHHYSALKFCSLLGKSGPVLKKCQNRLTWATKVIFQFRPFACFITLSVLISSSDKGQLCSVDGGGGICISSHSCKVLCYLKKTN